ncbi:response regulator [Tundrisphaera sp. TA3]|uniref:response regulator n=1 Tax=Tundrisphaera sp. TA3 TaxID=3435775 RepID=UPI003EB8BC4F
MGPKLRIVLADDHHIVRAGLRSLIEAHPGLEVVGEAADGESACRLAARLEPDMAVLDISMPVLGGPEATRRIKLRSPGIKVLILTVHEDRSYLQQALQAGASGYLLKRAAADDLIHAIHAVARGGTYLDPNLAGKILGGNAGRLPRPGEDPAPALSDREEEVLRLISRGLSNKEIAARLDLSIKTVETHRARGMEKLGIAGRAGIVAHAIRSGWLAGDEPTP